MSKYILIENTGVAAAESFTLLGASNKAGTEAIGQFGSGTKFGVLTLLRKGLKPVVFCGTLKLEFDTKAVTFDNQPQFQVQVRKAGKDPVTGKAVNRTEDLSVVLRYGEIDWKDKVELALREFVSNALDAANGDAAQVKVSLVESEPRAKAGCTRVFVPLTDDGESFVNNLSKWFLHFAGKDWKGTAIIEKDRLSPARIYRRGVFVREVAHSPNSLFDYNLNDLPLDEARIASDYSVQHYAQRALNRVFNPSTIIKLLAAPADTWENGFDLTGQYDYTLTDVDKAQNKAAWVAAQDSLLDEKTIFAGERDDTTLAEGKGYKVVRLGDERYKNVVAKGLRTINNVLTVDEREGRKVDRATNPAAEKAVLHVWSILENIDATKGEKYPAVKSYTEHNTGGGITLGVWKDNTVFINNCLLSGNEISPELFAVCLEELAHHITKATDNSRGFQEYFIQTLTKVLR